MSFEAKWHLLARVGVRCYILISNVSGAVKVAPLQILQFPVVLPHKFQDAEKFNLQFPDFSEITETADKLRWLRYQKRFVDCFQIINRFYKVAFVYNLEFRNFGGLYLFVVGTMLNCNSR